LVGVDDLDYECDRFILKQCDSYAMHVLCYLFALSCIPVIFYILYYIMYKNYNLAAEIQYFQKLKKYP
jgi:hypothetical protein